MALLRNLVRVARFASTPPVVVTAPHVRRICSQNVFRALSSQANNKPPSSTASSGPKILSTLFPQTAVDPDNAERLKEEQRKEEEDKKEKDKQWKRMKIGFYIFGAGSLFSVAWTVYDIGAPERDEHGNVIEDEFSHLPVIQQYFKRMWRSLTYYQKIIQEPSSQKLLPDPLKYPYIQPPYTLVLELKDVLVHPDWTYKTGWRFKKRPGVDQFLEQCARHFEIVVYTAEQGMTVFPILDALDPRGYIMYRLVRDATHFVEGHHVKNLDNLNRDLHKVIVVDWDANSVKLHPDNALIVPRWSGNDDDMTLLELAAFLNTIATSDVEDVREVLSHYRKFDDPLQKFKENLLRLQEMEAKEMEEKKKQPDPVVKKWSPSIFSVRK